MILQLSMHLSEVVNSLHLNFVMLDQFRYNVQNCEMPVGASLTALLRFGSFLHSTQIQTEFECVSFIRLRSCVSSQQHPWLCFPLQLTRSVTQREPTLNVVVIATKVKHAAQRAGVAVTFRLSTLNAASVLKVMDSVLVAQVTMVPPAAQPVGSACPKVVTILGANLRMDAQMWNTSSAVDQSSTERNAAQLVTSAEPLTSTTQIAELAKPDHSSSVVARAGRDQTSQLAAFMVSCAQLKMSTTLNASLLRLRTC